MATRGWKARFAFLAFGPPLLFAAALAADAAWNDPDEPGGVAAAFLPGLAAVVLWGIGLAWGLAHLERSRDLAHGERRRWEAILVVMLPISLPVLWWTRIRPLDEGGPRFASPRPDPDPDPDGAGRPPTAMIGTPDKLLAAWILGVPLAVIIALAVYLVAVKLL